MNAQPAPGRAAPHIGWGITDGMAASAYDMLDQAPNLSPAELADWFGLSTYQGELLRENWHWSMAQAVPA